MADILDDFVKGLRDIYGANLRSIVLYGSKASREDAGERSDYNLLVILDEVKFDDLRADGIIRSWVRRGNEPPLLFSKEMFERSADVFPIEYHDMHDNRVVLYGENPFAGIEIHDRNLRHQCEYELKGKLLKLRQAYMAGGHSKKAIAALLIDSLASFLAVFSHVLRLSGEVPPTKKLDALTRLGELAGIDTLVFEAVRRMKQGDRQAKALDPDGLMRDYLAQIEKVVEYVDRFERT